MLTQPSAAQQEVFDVALSLGFDAVHETEAAGVSVDIALPPQRVAIEVQGATHFARNRPDVEIGNSRWKQKLLEASGWAVVSVNAGEFGEVRGLPHRRRFLSERIAAALNARRASQLAQT